MLRTFKCKLCSKDFQRNWYPAAKPNRFQYCSKECRHAARLKHTEKECPICGKSFYPRTSHAMKYCSRDCAISASRTKVTRVCKQCNKSFQVKPSQIKKGGGKYCSRKCMYEGRRDPDAFIECECRNCGKIFTVLRSQVRLRNGGQYCSNDCRFEYCIGPNHPVWIEEKNSYYYGKDWAEISEQIRERDNYTCQVCGKKRKKGLHVHHIVKLITFGDDLESANDSANLIALCVQCHNKVEQGLISFQPKLPLWSL